MIPTVTGYSESIVAYSGTFILIDDTPPNVKNRLNFIGVCRDGFHMAHHLSSTYKRNNIHRDRFIFTCQRDYGAAVVADFIHGIEDRLGVEHSQFYLTDLKPDKVRNSYDGVLIFPNHFWFEYYLRFSLFTALVRASQTGKQIEDQYDPNCIDNEYIVSNTSQHVQAFLAGYTVPQWDRKYGTYLHFHHGWYARCQMYKPFELLLKPEVKATHAA